MLVIGRQTCDGELGWGECGAQMPTTEVCNQIDDDCNGLTDDIPGIGEECVREADVEGETLRCRGRLVCNQDSLEPQCTAQIPSEERCNFLDDDCDGNTDEGFEQRDQVCTVGVGLCQRFGVYECNETPPPMSMEVETNNDEVSKI